MNVRHARNTRKEHETMVRPTSPPWSLVAALAALGLARPLLSIAGAYQFLGTPWTPMIVTALISALWVGVVVLARAPNPLFTLTAVGGLYGVLAIILQQVIWNLILGGPPEEAPSSAPILVVSWLAVVVTNAIWGAFLGLVALGIGRLLPRRGA